MTPVPSHLRLFGLDDRWRERCISGRAAGGHAFSSGGVTESRRTRMNDGIVPVIDIGPFLAGDPVGRVSVPLAVARACEEIGFFTIVGHGVDPQVIGAATSAARQFFDLPVADKQRARSADPAISRGYRGIGN